MFHRLRLFLSMIRFSHTVFALPFVLLAAVMAWTVPRPDGNPFIATPTEVVKDLLGILICMVAARSAAMAFNRLVDRNIDAANPRTQGRHLPAGLLSVPAVITFTMICSLVFVVGTLLFLPNWLPVALSLPVLLFLFAYSYAKRFTALVHFWLGAALCLSPICGWIAIRGSVVLEAPSDLIPPVLLGAAVLLWVAGFDIIYACLDYGFDKQSGTKSVPASLGVPGALRLAAACHLGMIVALAVLPWASPQLTFGWVYGLAVVAVAGLLAYEHTIVRPDDLQRVNVAFFHVNAIVSIGLFVVGTIDLLW